METPYRLTPSNSQTALTLLFISTQKEVYETCCSVNQFKITFDHYIGKHGVKRNSLVGPDFYSKGTITYIGKRDGIDLFMAMNPEDMVPTMFMGELKILN